MIDINLAYLLLVGGLWLGITATYVPGTGVMEALGLGATALGIILLANLPTQWVAVLILVVSMGVLLLAAHFSPRRSLLPELALPFYVGASWFLFSGVTVSWLLIALTAGLLVAYRWLVLLPLIERMRGQLPVLDDDRDLIGARGRITGASRRSGAQHFGTVTLHGEQWTAISDVPLRLGDEVIILERTGLQLTVEPSKRKGLSGEAQLTEE